MQAPTKTEKSEHTHLTDLSTFSTDNVVIKDPETSEFNGISMTKSTGKYLDENGNEADLYFDGPSQSVFGVSYLFEMNTKEDEQVPENAKGLQVCFPITSLSTMKNPTPEEQAFSDLLLGLFNMAYDKGQEEATLDNPRIPQSSVSSFLAAGIKGNKEKAVKMPFDYGNQQGKKVKDLTKPQRMYIKLFTSGKGEKLKADTRFYGPGDVTMSPLKFIGQRGIMSPVIKWEGIYWGSHGQTPCGASLIFRLAEATFTPQRSAGLTPKRLAGKNNADADPELMSPDNKKHEDHTGEAEGFTPPEGVKKQTNAEKLLAGKPAKPSAPGGKNKPSTKTVTPSAPAGGASTTVPKKTTKPSAKGKPPVKKPAAKNTKPRTPPPEEEATNEDAE